MTKISIYKNVLDNKGGTIDLFEALEAIKTGGLGLAEHQAKVRAAIGDEQKRLKEKTLAITPSGEFSARVDSKLIQHTGFLNFDIDKIEDLPAVYEIVANDKHCFAIWLSISGKGISGLFKVPEGLDKDSHIEAYKDMMAYFSEFHGIDVDESCQNVSRLRFLSHDENLTIDKNAQVFTWKRPKEKPQKAIPRRMTARMLGGANYITEYNEKTPCLGLLESYGWTFLYSKGGKDRLTRPNGSKGQNHGEVFSDNRFQSYTNFERIGSKPDKPSSPFDIFCHYEHGGDEESAKNAIRPFELGARNNSFEDIPPPNFEEIPYQLNTEEIFTSPIPTTTKQATSIKIKTSDDKEVVLPTFPIDSLPQHFQNIIAAVCDALDTPPDLLACSMMMAASVAAGHSVRLRLANGWTQSCSLFMALIGDSAAGKSPAMDFAFKHLRGKDASMIKQYNKDKEEFDLAQMEKETRGSIQKPVKSELILEDSTIESTMQTLSENKYGVGLVVDEIAGWINSMNQYKAGKGSEEKKWLTIFDNRDLKKSTIGRGTQVVMSPFVSVIGGIQPQVLHQIAKDGRNYDGFMFRFMFCIAEQKKAKKWDALVESEIPQEVENAWSQAIENLLGIRDTAQQFKIDNDNPFEGKECPEWLEARLVHKSKGGQLWGKWYDDNNKEKERAQANGEHEKVSALTKLSIIASRLMLLNQLLLVAQGSDAFGVISEEAVKSALKQTAYFKQTAFYAFSIINEQSEGNSLKESRCNWTKIFTSQEDVNDGLQTKEIVERILNQYGKAKRTAIAWIKSDLTEAPKLPEDSGRVKRYTI